MKQAKRTIAILLSMILLLIAATGIPMTAMAAGSKTEYTFQLSVKTTNDADGWNNASFILSNSMDHSVQDRYWDIKSNIDDSDEEWSTTFSSKDFYDVARLYVDFGGGLGSRLARPCDHHGQREHSDVRHRKSIFLDRKQLEFASRLS